MIRPPAHKGYSKLYVQLPFSRQNYRLNELLCKDNHKFQTQASTDGMRTFQFDGRVGYIISVMQTVLWDSNQAQSMQFQYPCASSPSKSYEINAIFMDF